MGALAAEFTKAYVVLRSQKQKDRQRPGSRADPLENGKAEAKGYPFLHLLPLCYFSWG